MTARPVIGSLATVRLEAEEFAPGAVIDGSPVMTSSDLWVSPDERVCSGIWSVTPGTFNDVMDGDETFVVLSGRMTVAPADGSAPFEVKAGDVCVFPVGYRSVWTVHETIVKGYHIMLPAD